MLLVCNSRPTCFIPFKRPMCDPSQNKKKKEEAANVRLLSVIFQINIQPAFQGKNKDINLYRYRYRIYCQGAFCCSGKTSKMKSQCWKGNCHTKGGDFETVSRKPQHSWECRGNLGIKSYMGLKNRRKQTGIILVQICLDAMQSLINVMNMN